ncbi:hypothetical protein [Nannocystis sp. SCPEA4]|uniref:hypothetical protein n=1 Tax=Nannocystis sp. SCPEA4 TaxID=2996787 RepID=UPI00226DCB9E|nr:hypothetical protein [Nannocystis sp. SCPEA4]MCY1060258.1 hypothetical protein [Nannocystis sp. SCPEA4]
MRLGRITGAAVAMAATLACGGGGGSGTDSDTGTGGTTGEPIEFAEFFDHAEAAYCGWATRCGAFAAEEDCRAAEFFDSIYPSNLLAEARFDDGVSGQIVEYLLASHAAGRLEFDAEAAVACLAYVEARGCARPGTYVPDEAEAAGRAACAAVIRGTMVKNGPCLLSAECAPQDDATVVCGFDPTCSDVCCVGGCRVLGSVPVGTPCNFATRCESGSFCASDPNTGFPTVCTAQQPVGGSCLNQIDCDASGFCVDGKCKALAGEGERCGDWGQGGCQPGLFCAAPGDDMEGRCYAYNELGGACPGQWYEDGCSEYGVYCDWNSSQCVGPVGPGESCSERPCGLTSTCDWQTNTCLPLSLENEPCGDSRRCAGALQCDGWDPSTARCRAPVIDGVCAVPGEDVLPEGT